MKYHYNIEGLTCEGCVNSVKLKLQEVLPESSVNVSLSESKVVIESAKKPIVEILQMALPKKYLIKEFRIENEITIPNKKYSKLKELKPLLLIVGYILVASILLHQKDRNPKLFMIDFMGLFFIVFSFFKLLDLKGFAKTFKMYDPFAKRVGVYAQIYPFIEVALGLLFLFRFQIQIAILVTLAILSITTFGVVKALLSKQEIQCACLGTVLKLKMTEATFIENSIIIVMGLLLLSNL